MNKNPWKALMPYSFQDQHIFYGRDNEMLELSSLIEYNQVVTLYGKSGIGKSSLLNAGVSPKLLLNGFYPYTIRLKKEENFKDADIPFAEMILSQLADNRTTSLEYFSKDIFTQFFRDYESFNGYGEKIIPVIILDQFEELLIEDFSKTELLLKQIVEWTNNKTSVSSNCHFVISIREDDLYLLEELLDKNRLNSLKFNRYRLRKITRKGAEEVIRKGGKNIIESEAVIEKILQTLGSDSMNSFEASELSLMCSLLYDSMKEAQLGTISVDLVNKNAISSIQEYYKSVIQKLEFSKDEIKSFENEFVTDAGRRAFVSEDRFKKLFRPDICDKLLNPNSDYKILTKVNDKIEIVHDLLAKAVKTVKDEHAIVDLEQTIKQEKFICYSSLFPVLLITVYVLFHFFPPILDVLHNQGISNIDFNKYYWIISLPILWILPRIILKRGQWLKNIDVNHVYGQVCCVYSGVILFCIWLIFFQKSLTVWAWGVNVLPFIALGMWIQDDYRKNISENPFLFLSLSLGSSILLFLSPVNVETYYPLMGIIIISVICGLFFFKKLSCKLKIFIMVLFLIMTGITFYKETHGIYLCLIILSLTIIFICMSFKGKKHLMSFFLLMVLGTFLLVLQVNPYLLLKYVDVGKIKVIPKAFVLTDSDSVYIKNAWDGEKYIDWPLIAKDSSEFGVLPIKEVSDTISFSFYPFKKGIPNVGYEMDYIRTSFFEGIKVCNLKSKLDTKLNKLEEKLKDLKKEKDAKKSKELQKVELDFNLKKNIMYPIKLNVARMFNESMIAINERIRHQVTLTSDCNTYYATIDSLCKIYFEEFKDRIKKEIITEYDLYFYQKLIVCQLTNSFLQESFNRDDIQNVIQLLSFLVYLNLSEEELYSTINYQINVTLKNDFYHHVFHFCILKDLMDDEKDLVEIRNLFDFISSLAVIHQSQWKTTDVNFLTEENKSAPLLDANKTKRLIVKFESIMYDGTPYLKSFCQHQNELLTKIIKEMRFENRVYTSYFEYMGVNLILIQPLLNVEAFLNAIDEGQKESIKRVKNYTDKIDSLTNETLKFLIVKSKIQELISKKH